LSSRVRNTLLLMLTAAAGSTDAVAYLGLGRVFTANMTGNLVLLGIAMVQGQLAGSFRSVVAFIAFAAGAFVGDRLAPPDQRSGIWPRSVTVVMFVELGLLIALAVGWAIAGDKPTAFAVDLLIAPSAGAMGMQSAAARGLRVAGVTTTFVTGTLSSLIAELAWVSPDWHRWTLWAATLGCVVIGAAGGAAVFLGWRPGAPLVSLLLVAIVTAMAMWLRRTPD